jgi:nucleoside-triphosphatase THEP1
MEVSPMSCAIIVHGPIGSGKTLTCLRLIERARAIGLHPKGITSPRVFLKGRLIGYDCMDIATGESFPLVRLLGEVGGPDWSITYGGKYAFSNSGFERANRILINSAESLSQRGLIFVDEFGRIEKSGEGILLGLARVSEALSEGGTAVLTCRGDLVETVESLIKGRALEVRKHEPGDLDAIWGLIKKNHDLQGMED